MTSNIYDQHDAAFWQVSAYVVVGPDDRTLAARIAFKHPPKGHGERRVWCYLHVLGSPMVRGKASGCGYDKRSAAIGDAARKLAFDQPDTVVDRLDARQHALLDIRHAILAGADSGTWQRNLEDAGYRVFTAAE